MHQPAIDQHGPELERTLIVVRRTQAESNTAFAGMMLEPWRD